MQNDNVIEQASVMLLGRINSLLYKGKKTVPRPGIESITAREGGLPHEQAECGGYNEAYVIHHWACFGPTHWSLK